jgi:GT2 family glycosyltransferase
MGASEDKPRLSIVLSTLGNYEVLGKVLDGYERQDAPPGSFEVLVVSDLKEPDPAAVERAIGKRPYPIRRLTGSVPGLSANRNTGWHAARAPIVLFTDNDTIPVARLVSEHLETHERFPQREVAVAGHVRWARGIKVTPFMKWLDRGIQFDYRSLRGEEGSWAHLYGANSSIKVAMLEVVGGYDEVRLPYLYEDLDWGWRAREHGLRVIYNRRAIVDHWRPMTLEVWQKRAPMLAATEWQFWKLHPEFQPFFHMQFSDALSYPPARRWPQIAAGFVPEWVPWIGPRIWSGAGLGWRQRIAPYFLESWNRAAAGEDVSVAPDVAALLSERSGTPGGP